MRSSGELAVLLLAASLAGVEAGSLRDLTAGLGPNALALVLDAIAHRAGWHETGRSHRTTGRLPGPTPDHLRPAITRLRDLAADAHRRQQVLQQLRESGREVWMVTPELAADRPDLAAVTVTVTDYRDVLTHPHTAREAGDLLGHVIKTARHVGYTITLGVDLAADPTGLDWLAPLRLAGTVARNVPAATGWDPHVHRATARVAAQALTAGGDTDVPAGRVIDLRDRAVPDHQDDDQADDGADGDQVVAGAPASGGGAAR